MLYLSLLNFTAIQAVGIVHTYLARLNHFHFTGQPLAVEEFSKCFTLSVKRAPRGVPILNVNDQLPPSVCGGKL